MANYSGYTQWLNGQVVTEADRQQLAMLNTGHFTALQSRDGRVKGWNIHLNRLENASQQLFGIGIDKEAITSQVRSILRDQLSCSLRIHIFSTAADLLHVTPRDLQVLIIHAAPVNTENQEAISISTATYERFLPEVKHAGISIAALYHKRQARLKGFDDVLYTNAAGDILEGSIWNIVFYNGQEFVFSAAQALNGTMQQMIIQGLQQLNIPYRVTTINQQELHLFQAAFIINSIHVARPVSRIDEVIFHSDSNIAAILSDAYAQTHWERL
ncbi:MAG TPA: aminotransferase class IV [Chitinophaga sp.]|uniref:aminotransferase class IV n=1 Tax=Chitinophaga sp. TaxID=1869181 RepID=UPI002CE9CCF7|nr:aminotransferase class IV [Chitinophaga sp.]HVI47729.1 aminotransferase class IV [Chitinophaga sp.]